MTTSTDPPGRAASSTGDRAALHERTIRAARAEFDALPPDEQAVLRAQMQRADDAAAFLVSGWTDRAGRAQRVTDDPLTTAPAHAWDGDENGHNCRGCPEGGVWMCDEPAHPEHDPGCFTQKPGPIQDCDCLVWQTIRRYQARGITE